MSQRLENYVLRILATFIFPLLRTIFNGLIIKFELGPVLREGGGPQVGEVLIPLSLGVLS